MTPSYDVLCCDLGFSEFNWTGLSGASLDRNNHMKFQILLYLDSKDPKSRMVSPVTIIVKNSHKFTFLKVGN